jgi:hypothetical protein
MRLGGVHFPADRAARNIAVSVVTSSGRESSVLITHMESQDAALLCKPTIVR